MGLYAAYASNLDPAQMARRCPHSPLQTTGWLVGWRLTFGGEDLSFEGALATIVEESGSTVFVAVYDITDEDIDALDRWEGVDLGFYNKIHVPVRTLEGDLIAWLYALDGYEGGLPTARYLGLMADAAEAAGAPDDYVHDLRIRECRSSDS